MSAGIGAVFSLTLLTILFSWNSGPKKLPERPKRHVTCDKILDYIGGSPKDDQGTRTFVLTLREGDSAWNPRIDSRTLGNQTYGPCVVTYQSDKHSDWKVKVNRPGVTEEEERAAVKEAWRKINWMRKNTHIRHLW